MVGLKVKRKDGGKMVKERLRARTAEKLRLRSSSSKHEAWSTEQQFASLLRSKFEFEERSTKQLHEAVFEARTKQRSKLLLRATCIELELQTLKL